jgi:hypothetical protein
VLRADLERPKSSAHSLRIAIASSMPPRIDSRRWKTCMRTCARRPSCSSSSLVRLKYWSE